MAVVKSNAYGHGLPEITDIIHKAEHQKYFHTSKYGSIWFGVDNLDEARTVLKIAPHNPVLVLGYTQNERFKEAARLGARITVYNWETLHALKSLSGKNFTIANKTPLRVHVELETGTTRQGIGEREAVDFVKALRRIKGVEVEGISTHFANIEDTAQPDYAKKQLARYNSVIMRLKRAKIASRRPLLRHIACTAATLLFPETYGNLVRVGIGLYGLWPSDGVKSNVKSQKSKINLQPVLTWKTIVAQIKEVKNGTPVSYGLTERVRKSSRVAVLPVGYWDGYDRRLSRIGQVLINDKRCKVLGRVCMNMTMVEATEAGRVKPEDEVVLLGRQGREEVSADEIAAKLSTINYEIVTRINPLIPRIVI